MKGKRLPARPKATEARSERLHKALATAGVGSRRLIETWITEGRIMVNGQIATLGQQIFGDERVQIDGRSVSLRRPTQGQVLIYHKPEGEVTTRHDPEGRPTVFKRLPKPQGGRWINIGRLDINTSGLLLLTNDGELAHRLMHPKYGLEREYAVRVLGKISEQILQNLITGVMLEDGIAQFERIEAAGGTGANHWYHVILKEGRTREVRRLWESQGVVVSRLLRVRYGSMVMPAGLASGHWRLADDQALTDLYASVELAPGAIKKTAEVAAKPVRAKRLPPTRAGRNKTEKSPSPKPAGPISRRSPLRKPREQ